MKKLVILLFATISCFFLIYSIAFSDRLGNFNPFPINVTHLGSLPKPETSVSTYEIRCDTGAGCEPSPVGRFTVPLGIYLAPEYDCIRYLGQKTYPKECEQWLKKYSWLAKEFLTTNTIPVGAFKKDIVALNKFFTLITKGADSKIRDYLSSSKVLVSKPELGKKPNELWYTLTLVPEVKPTK